VALLSGAILAAAIPGQETGPTSVPPSPRPLHRYEFERAEMGVPFRVVLYAWNPALAKVSATAALDRVRELNAVFSDYEPESELSRVSRTAGSGVWVSVSDELWRVLDYAQQLARETDGAFDVTVGPATALWRRARRVRELPPSDALRSAREAVGFRHLALDPTRHKVRLAAGGMKLDLGGVAKGVALDEAMQVLEARGIRHALLSGGGDLRVSDAPPGESGWRIELAPLDAPEAPPTRFLRLKHAALATSGDLYQRVEIDGVRYSHVVDPRTCLGLTDHSLVTVIAPEARWADSLATAISVLGPERGLELVRAREGVEAHIARRPREQIEIVESAGFARFVERGSREPVP
jgi:thiamine biosynthesis lipoprotein